MGRSYTAEIRDGSYKVGPSAQFRTIAECRKWAEEFSTANRCTIIDEHGRLVALHCRNRETGDWYQGYLPALMFDGTEYTRGGSPNGEPRKLHLVVPDQHDPEKQIRICVNTSTWDVEIWTDRHASELTEAEHNELTAYAKRIVNEICGQDF